MDNNIFSKFELYHAEWPDIITMKDAYKLPGFPYTKLGFANIGRRYPLSVLKNKKVIPNTINKADLLSFLFARKNSADEYLTNKIKKIIRNSHPMTKNELISIGMKLIQASSAFRSCRCKQDKEKDVAISIGRREIVRNMICLFIRKKILYEKDGKLYLK